MTSEQQNPHIDFSHAKEPPSSLNLAQDKETAPIEPEEVSKQIEPDSLSGDFNSQEESRENVGERQIINANIVSG